MSGRLLLWAVVVAVLGALVVVVSEAAMASTSGDPATLYGVFLGSALAAALLGWWLRRTHRRLRSLRWTMLVVATAAVVVVTAVVAASTSAMFLAVAELRLVLAALLLGAGLGVLLSISVAGPLTADLRALAAAARRVADGDLDVRSGVERADEVGELARSLDRMVAQLARLEEQRVRDDVARRHLLTSIGHDLRTPLASLQAAIEALEDGVAPDPPRYLRAMASDVASLRDMVSDLFVLTELDAGVLQLEPLPVDLGELADGAAEAIRPLAAQRDVEVVATTAGSPSAVVADARALDRVLRNLLDNAVRHAPAGTTVRVEVGETREEVLVTVRDDGPGFPDGFAQRAFERFARADVARERDGGGAGLGLAIAKELVEAHGGRIWIGDAAGPGPGPGATVGFAIPVGSVAALSDEEASPVGSLGRDRT